MPSPQPLYDPATATAAYSLRYAWSGWCAAGGFPQDIARHIIALRPAWEADGLRVLEHRVQDDMLQILFSVTPQVSPEFIAARAKGRLDHAFRKAGIPVSFTRKVAVRSLGENTRADVEGYVARQVAKADYADPRWKAALEEMIFTDADVDLFAPHESARGRYWYGLHIVLVTGGREPFSEIKTLRSIRDGCRKIAAKKELRISRLAVMPDHLHIAVGPPPHLAPVEVVSVLQNNLAWLLGQRRVWRDGYYAGTFGDYDLGAVRQRVRRDERG